MSSTDPNALAEPMGSLIRYVMVLGRKEGKRATLTSGLRTRDQQIDLRRRHCGTSQYQIFEAPSSACTPYTARPGTSKHETGQAADMGGDKEWIATQLAPFDVDRRVPGEDWHFQYYGSDAAGTLGKLQGTMTAKGFSDAERSEVAGNGNSFQGVAESGGFSLPGLPSVPGLDGLTSLAATLARPVTDAEFRKRIAIAIGGAILIYGAGQLLARDLLTEALNG